MSWKSLFFILIMLPAGSNNHVYAENIPSSETTKSEVKKAQKQEISQDAEKNANDKKANDKNDKKEAEKQNETEKSPDDNTLKITILGAGEELKKNLELLLPAYRPDCNVEKASIKKYLKSVKAKMRKASRAMGYYDSVFKLTTKTTRNCWHIVANVTPGKPVIVRSQKIKITGAGTGDKAFRELQENYPYKNGDVLNHKKYASYKASLIEAAQSLGYFDAAFKAHVISLDLARHQADIDLHFETGERFRFGEISVEQDILGKDYINRFIVIKTGEFFSTDELIRQQQLLQNSGYYAVVKVDAKHQQAKNRRVPVVIALTPRKRNAYRFKLGYGTDTGLRAAASLERRWTGARGRKLNIDLGLSERINEIEARLTIPKEDPEENNMFYSVGWKQEDNNDIQSESFKIGAVLTSHRGNDWQRTISLSYLDDKTQVEGQSAERSRLTLLGANFTKVHAEDRLYPDNGWRLRFHAQAAIDKVLSDYSFLQLRADGKHIKSIGDGRLISRLEVGTTLTDSLSQLPKDLRFFSGGINSVRGYGFEALGEVNLDGKVIGGKHMLLGSLEYEYPVKDKWSAVAFIDAGNAFDDWSYTNIQVGMGVGARWRSPIGPLRIDLGWPKDDVSAVRLHVSIGPDL
jgi:translocation and assembly module TamA